MSEGALRAAQVVVSVLGLTLPCTTGQAEPGNALRGERVFQRCFACHSVDPNEKLKLQGPTLHKIVGRPAAAIADFDYSVAMKSKAGAGLVWDVETLERYIADPDSVVPGTNMSAPPLRDEQERADLLAYLARSGPYRP